MSRLRKIRPAAGLSGRIEYTGSYEVLGWPPGLEVVVVDVQGHKATVRDHDGREHAFSLFPLRIRPVSAPPPICTIRLTRDGPCMRALLVADLHEGESECVLVPPPFGKAQEEAAGDLAAILLETRLGIVPLQLPRVDRDGEEWKRSSEEPPC